MSGAIFGKYTFDLCSLMFSHRPNEAALVWRLQKLVCYKLLYSLCFSIQEPLKQRMGEQIHQAIHEGDLGITKC